jgi:transporter family-2 protein
MQVGTMLLAFAVGAGLVVQVGMNVALGRALGNPVLGALANFLVGSVAIAAFVMLRVDLPGRAQFASAPAWAWFGGLFGAMYVTVATLAGPRIGALLLLALTVAGQMVASIIVDHYGLLGFAQQPVTAVRLLGVALLVAGIVLVAR